MKYGIALSVILGLQVLMPITCHATNSTDVFNGYYPGMSMNNAKKLGVVNCHVGGQFPEDSNMIYCHPTADHSRLGEVSTKDSFLAFNRKSSVLSEILLTFDEGQKQQAIIEMQSRFGVPNVLNQGSIKYSWPTNDDIVITGYSTETGQTKWRTLSVKFLFQFGRAKLIKKNALKQAKYENALRLEVKRYESQ